MARKSPQPILLQNFDERLRQIDDKLVTLCFQVDKLVRQQQNAVERADETEEERSDRYRRKIHELLAKDLPAGSVEFLTGVRMFINREGIITKRQAAVVDRIYGEQH